MPPVPALACKCYNPTSDVPSRASPWCAQIKEEQAERERLQDQEYMRQAAAQLWVALVLWLGEAAAQLGGLGWPGLGRCRLGAAVCGARRSCVPHSCPC